MSQESPVHMHAVQMHAVQDVVPGLYLSLIMLPVINKWKHA